MKTLVQFTKEIYIADQPTEEDLAFLAHKGILSIVNLRLEGELNQPITPFDEEKIAQRHQLHYYHFPVSFAKLKKNDVDVFRQELKKLPRPLVVHCQRGVRAAALVVMDYALRKGMTGAEGLQYVKSYNIDFNSAQIDEFIMTYIDERKGAGHDF